MNIKKQMKKENAITLIALVVTIVVLLILAAVTTKIIVNENGLMTKAHESKEETEKAKVLEDLTLKMMGIQADKKGSATLQDVVNYLKEDTKYEYVISLQPIATISGEIPDVSNVNEIYVLYKNYQFKIDNRLEVTLIGSSSITEDDKDSRKESDLGTTHVINDEWVASVPTDNWFAKEEYYDIEWEGKGTQESPYLIQTESELAGLSYKVSKGKTYDSSIYFKLTEDLSMGKHIWIPIGGRILSGQNVITINTTNTFNANFDGDNHTISGLYCESDENSYIGLFGYINSDIQINNIGITDSYFRGSTYVGSIAGYIKKGKIINSYNSSTIIGKSYVGGLVGQGHSAYIYKSYNIGNIYSSDRNYTSGGMYFGGLAGYGYFRIISSYNSGNINVINEKEQNIYVGGMTSYTINSSTCYNSYNIGNIYVETNSDNSKIGGIYGQISSSGYIYNCYNAGNIETTQGSVGGLVGVAKITSNNSASIQYSYYLKNSNYNTSLDFIGTFSDSYSKFTSTMVGYFDSKDTTNFTYMNDEVEKTAYVGNLLTKLNKWISSQNNIDYLNWKLDEVTGYPTFIYK